MFGSTRILFSHCFVEVVMRFLFQLLLGRTVGVSTTLVADPRYQFMITAGILAAAAADILLVELEDGWRYAICLQARKTARDSVRRVFRMLSCF